MNAILNVSRQMQAYRLGIKLAESLEVVLMNNISRVHSKTRISDKAVSIKTQQRRFSTICASFVELREGGYALTSPYSLKQKHVEFLVSLWVGEKQQGGTIENKLTHLRTLCEWMRKDNVVFSLDDYVDRDALGLKRSYVTKIDKSWEGNGVDATALIARIGQEYPRVAVQLKLQAAFGLRVEEGFLFKVHRALKDISTLRVTDGTKGSRPREVPVLLRLSVLEEAAHFSSPLTGTTMPADTTLSKWRTHYYEVMKKFGVTREGLGITSHGLRHQFLQEYYKRLTGEDAPIKGGARPGKDVLQSAIQHVVEAAGHSRASKSGAYLSTHAAMERKETVRVSVEQAVEALSAAMGNKSHAAKALGVSRQALYRALEKAASPRRPPPRRLAEFPTHATGTTTSRRSAL